VKPHVLLEHVGATHSFAPAGHCEGWVHCTHAPSPSQKLPPFWVQAVSAAELACEGTPLVHTPSVHWFASVGTSLSAFTITIAPAPSHCDTLQSPAVCAATCVPDAV
jgi:hypothetical protein